MSTSNDSKKMIGQRLRSLREKSGMTQSDLAARINITRHSLSNYEIGRAVPPSYVLKKLAEILHTSTDFILGNTEDPLSKDDQLISEFTSIINRLSDDDTFIKEVQEDVNNALQKFGFLLEGYNFTYSPKEVKEIMKDNYSFYFKTELYGAFMNIGIKHGMIEGGLKSSERQMKIEKKLRDLKVQLEPTSAELVQIPIYGEIKAGYGLIAEDNIVGFEVTSRDSVGDGDYFYLIVKGDSMIDEGIYEGMRVLVRKQNHCQNGKIGVVIVDGEEGTLKRVYYEDDNVVLRASNRRIPPRPYPLEDVIIQGQVTKVEFDV